jgi:hypothetical protein
MSTTTAEAVYVRCDQFCGAKINLTGEAGAMQHLEGCGATADDLARLDAELGTKRIQSAAAASMSDEPDEALDAELPVDPVPPAQFVCSCNAAFDTWPELGVHQTETQHQGMARDENSALDDEALNEREDTVDGVNARVVHNGQSPFVEVEVTDESVLGNLARAMEAEATLRTAANTAKNALAHAVKKTKAAAEFAAHHWAHSRQMTMNLTPGGTEPDDDDGEDA